ncbi:elongin-A3 member D-like [Microtus oregoni]|uniref:elongin-A3 member D-like n=1 Tax=Microtus oregoni TaxID=111838 RepID=UPI001BB15099|nr:elongin-A3 member D-like [Microtus oregoni]
MESSAVEMEFVHQLETLLKLREHLYRETEPHKLYKTLKELSSQPILCDTMEKIGFRQTIKRLRKEQLLVPFAKEFATLWSRRSQFGPQSESDIQNFAIQASLMTESSKNSPEDKPHEPRSKEDRENGRKVLEVSSTSKHPSPGLRQSPNSTLSSRLSLSKHTSPDHRSTQNPKLEARGSKRHSTSCGDPRLAAQRQEQVAKCSREPVEEPRELQEDKLLSSKSDAGPAKQYLSPLQRKSPGHCILQGHPTEPSEACSNYDSSASSALPLPQPPCKRKKKCTRTVEAQRSVAKAPLGKSCSSKELNCLDVNPLPEVASTCQDDSLLDGPEQQYLHTDQEEATWAHRVNFRTPVYSGRAPSRLQKKYNKGCHAVPSCPLETQCQPAGDKAEPWQQVEKSLPQTHTAKAIPTQNETQTDLQLEKSQELRLQALKARIQSREAKKLQSRQTKLLTFDANNTISGQQTESGPGREASSDKNSLPEDSVPSHLQRAPCLPAGGSTKTQAKKRTPLMAKALRDYKRYSCR